MLAVAEHGNAPLIWTPVLNRGAFWPFQTEVTAMCFAMPVADRAPCAPSLGQSHRDGRGTGQKVCVLVQVPTSLRRSETTSSAASYHEHAVTRSAAVSARRLPLHLSRHRAPPQPKTSVMLWPTKIGAFVRSSWFMLIRRGQNQPRISCTEMWPDP